MRAMKAREGPWQMKGSSMKCRLWQALVSIAMLMAAGSVGYAAETKTAPDKSPVYLFSSFRGNGEDGLHLAYSRDGLKWTALNNDTSFLKPQARGKLMRDPCICQGPDGTFHMVWTTGWWDKGIGIAHSKDLITWSDQVALPVMGHEPNAVNCWAPEIFYDADSSQYIIFWATTIPGRFRETEPTDGGDKNPKGVPLNHRIYCVTTKDFATYAPTHLFYDGGFNAIDATIVRDGSKYVMFVKDETRSPQPKKNIRIATADKAAGPYSPASPPFTTDWVEGPTAIKIGDTWFVYFDAYTRHRYEGVKSKDLHTWENITDSLSFPPGTKHGTVFQVSEDVLDGLLKAT
jgi:beta-xylosidase